MLVHVSKAFTREEPAEAAVVVPPRAPLPAGTQNYVTPRGLELLRAESHDLARERAEAERAVDGAGARPTWTSGWPAPSS